MTMKKVKTQKGFALVVVLITLMILSLVVASLLRNQTLALQETSILLTAAQNEQNSRNAHQACVNQVRQNLRSTGTANGTIVWANLNTNAFNVGANGGFVTCQIVIPIIPAANGAWTPKFQISTTVGTITETSTLAYEPCVNQPCQSSVDPLQIATSNGQIVNVVPTWAAGSSVQVSWQR